MMNEKDSPYLQLLNMRAKPTSYGDGEINYEAIMMAAPHEEIEDDDWERVEMKEVVSQYTYYLDPRETWIIDAIMSERKSLQQIANELGITKTHVWRLRNQAFSKLKEIMSQDPTIRKKVNIAKTWEESASQWMLMIGDTEKQKPANIHYMEDTLEYMRQAVLADEEPRYDAFLLLARRTASLLRELDNWDTGEMLSLVIGKQKDYGHGNINSFGLIGIVVRLSDKIERYKNLLLKNRQPVNEKTVDTLHDIVGYCLIALMFLDGTFQLELGDDQ
jgi:DNA-binding CsgD family transcriptional regulator